jgi:hypothetical protein
MTVLAHPYFPALLARNLFIPPFMQEFMAAKEGASFHILIGMA